MRTPLPIIAVCGRAAFAFLASSIWLAYTLAEFGHFRAWPCLAVGAVAGLAVVRIARRGATEPADAGYGKQLLLVAAIAAGSLLLTLPSSELVLGGWDPGVYLHTGAAVARGGSIRIADADFKRIPDVLKPLLCHDANGVWEAFRGMYILPDGRLVPSFHHLYPSLLAIAWSLGGLHAELGVNQVLHIASIFAFFALAARIVGGRWAVAGTLILALNPAQIWQAGFCTAEMLTQLLFLCGFIFLLNSQQPDRRATLDAVLAGAAFGLAMLSRYDSVLLLGPLVALLVVSWRDLPQRGSAAVTVTLIAVLAAHAYLHERVIAPFYHPEASNVSKGLVLLALALVAWLLALRSSRLALRERIAKWSPALRVVAAVLFCAWVVWAWAVRPALQGEGVLAHRVEGLFLRLGRPDVFHFLSGLDARNMYYLGYLFGPPGLALACVGVVLLMLQLRPRSQLVWLYSSLAVMLLLVTCLYNDHFLMWASRRLVPVTVPLLAIACSAALAWIAKIGVDRKGKSGVLAAALILAAVVACNVPRIKVVATTRDWVGLTSWYDRVAEHVPPSDVIYCDQKGFAAPLRFLYGRRALEMSQVLPRAREVLASVVLYQVRHGDNVFLLSMEGPLDHAKLAWDVVGDFPLATHTLNYSRVGFPEGIKERGGPFVLYRARLAASP